MRLQTNLNHMWLNCRQFGIKHPPLEEIRDPTEHMQPWPKTFSTLISHFGCSTQMSPIGARITVIRTLSPEFVLVMLSFTTFFTLYSTPTYFPQQFQFIIKLATALKCCWAPSLLDDTVYLLPLLSSTWHNWNISDRLIGCPHLHCLSLTLQTLLPSTTQSITRTRPNQQLYYHS